MLHLIKVLCLEKVSNEIYKQVKMHIMTHTSPIFFAKFLLMDGQVLMTSEAKWNAIVMVDQYVADFWSVHLDQMGCLLYSHNGNGEF